MSKSDRTFVDLGGEFTKSLLIGFFFLNNLGSCVLCLFCKIIWKRKYDARNKSIFLIR